MTKNPFPTSHLAFLGSILGMRCSRDSCLKISRHALFIEVAFVTCTLFVAISAHGEERLIKIGVNQKLPDQVLFNAHIRPIMSNTCFTCHGPDTDDNPSGFRLDSFTSATGQLASDETRVGIFPGDLNASEVFNRIMGRGDGEPMPPADFRHQLSDYEKALVQRWIEQGAEYQEHWSYSPIAKPTPPIETENPIDSFVINRLHEEGLDLSPEAGKATLLRRLSLDLIGLPPTPIELEDFLADDSDGAYAKQVDRLLASEHFGERQASFWLDLVRFSDTVGFHGDQNQRNFPYRDYVINAYNQNKPFDIFTRQQMAGDLLPNPTEEDLIATGMLRLNMVTREGGAQPKEYIAKYRADRVRTLGTAWLGSTLGCCECHNHKYDPFTANDFYSFGSFFDGLRQWGVYAEYTYTPNKDLRGFNNDYPFPPEMKLVSQSLLKEMQLTMSERDRLLASELNPSDLPDLQFKSWCTSTAEFLDTHPDGWIHGKILNARASQATTTSVLDDGSVLMTGAISKDESISIVLGSEIETPINAIRVEVLPDETNSGFVGRSPEGRFTVSFTASAVEADSNQTEVVSPIEIAWIQVDHENPKNYVNGAAPKTVDGLWRSGPAPWQLPSNESRVTHTAVIQFTQPYNATSSTTIRLEIKSDDIGRVKFAFTPLGHAMAGMPAASSTLLSSLNKVTHDLNPDDASIDEVVSAYHRSTVAFADQNGISKSYRDKLLDMYSGIATTVIAQEVPENQIPVSRVLPRGNWQDETGELTPPSFPEFLPKPSDESQRRLNRLDLANWLTSSSNPLVSRHVVNRTWKQFFGTGLSAKLDDLGNQGEWPSHPLLLDWLASEFVDSGWDTKHIIRLIVTSRSYKQAAAVRNDLTDIDPYNRLLAQQSPRRLEAEIIRDNALSIAGILRTDLVGGRSVFPYQPDGHYRNLQFPDRTYTASDDWRQYRRGIYMHWQRTFLHPMLVNFDAPSRDECTADRPLSNSPQQALTLLNDPQFVEAANRFSGRIVEENPDQNDTHKIHAACVIALSRTASNAELEGMLKMLQLQRTYFSENIDEARKLIEGKKEPGHSDGDVVELAAWAQVARVILNLHETITRF